jgi:hypothetical protein
VGALSFVHGMDPLSRLDFCYKKICDVYSCVKEWAKLSFEIFLATIVVLVDLPLTNGLANKTLVIRKRILDFQNGRLKLQNAPSPAF